jgi:hypothetical protein
MTPDPIPRAGAIASLLLLLAAVAAAQLTEAEKIERLLRFIEGSEVVFLRQGTEYTGPQAAAHLRWKWQQAGDRIATARDFVEQLGSVSSQTGKPYSVRLPDGTLQPARAWLLDALQRIETEGAAPEPRPASVAPQDVLELLRASPLTFLRVEDDEVEAYSGRSMAAHVELKSMFGRSAASAEEFIRRYCTRSMRHGTLYLVRLEDGREVALSGWLRERLGLPAQDD